MTKRYLRNALDVDTGEDVRAVDTEKVSGYACSPAAEMIVKVLIVGFGIPILIFVFGLILRFERKVSSADLTLVIFSFNVFALISPTEVKRVIVAHSVLSSLNYFLGFMMVLALALSAWSINFVERKAELHQENGAVVVKFPILRFLLSWALAVMMLSLEIGSLFVDF